MAKGKGLCRLLSRTPVALPCSRPRASASIAHDRGEHDLKAGPGVPFSTQRKTLRERERERGGEGKERGREGEGETAVGSVVDDGLSPCAEGSRETDGLTIERRMNENFPYFVYTRTLETQIHSYIRNSNFTLETSTDSLGCCAEGYNEVLNEPSSRCRVDGVLGRPGHDSARR